MLSPRGYGRDANQSMVLDYLHASRFALAALVALIRLSVAVLHRFRRWTLAWEQVLREL